MGNLCKNKLFYTVMQCFYALIIFTSVVIFPRSKPCYYPKPVIVAMSFLVPFFTAIFFFKKFGYTFFTKLYPFMLGVTVVYNTSYVIFCKTVGRTCYSVFYYMFFLFTAVATISVLTFYRLKNKNLLIEDKIAYAETFRNMSFIIMPTVLWILLFMFVINRQIGAVDSLSALNLIPTQGNIKQILRFFTSKFSDVESFYVFFGNVFFFSPIAFYINYYWKKPKKWFMIVLPVILSVTIELSQLLLKTGDPDIDDVILNVVGFYIGWWVYNIMIKTDATIFEYKNKGNI